MAYRRDIQVDLIKTEDGGRLLRLTHGRLGLSLEKTLDPQLPLIAQKKYLFTVFEAALEKAELSAI